MGPPESGGRKGRLEPWQQVLFAVAATCFVSFMGFSFVQPFLPFYVRSLGVERPEEVARWTGLILGVSPFISATTAPFWAVLAQRMGARRLLSQAAIGYAVLLFLMMIVTNVWQLFFLRTAFGLFGGFNGLANGLVAVAAPRDRMPQALGLVQASQILGTAVGPFLGGLTADFLGMRWAFGLAGLSMLASVFLTLVGLKPAGQAVALDAGRGAGGVQQLGVLLGLAGFLPVLVVLFLGRAVERSVDPVLPLYVHELAPDAQVATLTGIIAGAGTLATACSAALVGRISARFSVRTCLIWALVAGALCAAPIALVTSVWQLFVLRVLWGLLAGGSLTLALGLGGLLLPRSQRTVAYGLLGSATGYGASVGALSSGILGSFHLSTVFAIDGVIYLVCALWVWRAVPEVTTSPRSIAPAPR
ncbi:MAG: MFS transporter [Chloroflexi bacterium]|nr:MFS transporter [Chloroflexota bacterium]